MRIGFLFNHDQIHQISHSLPIALELAKGGLDAEIIVATTNDRLAAEVKRIGGAEIGVTIEHVELKTGAFTRRVDALVGKLAPARKLLVYNDNLPFFRGLDVLVVAEKTSLVLKRRHGLAHLGIVHTRHGAGDRSIGFNKASAGFDHVLCSGPKIRDRLVREAGVAPGTISIVGYPKFDLIPDAPPVSFLPTTDRVVLYNPHPSPHLSSWFRHGMTVFEQFMGNPRHGLLFAPHVMLFERPFVFTIDKFAVGRVRQIPQHLLRGENIKIDLGSRASTDMSYSLSADLYLGDASSQVYEFLFRPRPCIFLNSHRHAWQGDPNFQHWTAGEVINRPTELPLAIERAEELHAAHYRTIQEDLFARSFDLTEIPSSRRAADAVAAFCEHHARSRRH